MTGPLSEDDIESLVDGAVLSDVLYGEREPAPHYFTLNDSMEYIRCGHQRSRLPEPDVVIGKWCGWSAERLDAFRRGEIPAVGTHKILHYLGVVDVRRRVGDAAVNDYPLPEHDVTVGKRKGWAPETIDLWFANLARRPIGRKPSLEYHTRLVPAKPVKRVRRRT